MSFVSPLQAAETYPQPIIALGELPPEPASSSPAAAAWRLDLLQALPSCQTLAAVLEKLGQVARETLPGTNLYYGPRLEGGQLGKLEKCHTSLPYELSDADRTTIAALSQRACASGRARFQSLTKDGRWVAMVTPVFWHASEPHVLCAVAESAQDLRLLQVQLESLASYPSFWQAWHLLTRQRGRGPEDAMLALLTAMHEAPSLAAAGAHLVDHLQMWLRCQRVAIAVPRRGSCRLLAISGQQRIDARSEAAQTLTRALDEIATQPRPIRWSLQTPQDQQPEWPTLRRAASVTNASLVIGIPLRDSQDHVVAALLLLIGDDVQPQTWSEVQASLPVVAAALATITTAQRSLAPRAWDRGWKWCRTHQSRMILGAAAALLVVLLIPIPYRATSRFTVEPVTRRFVAAPFAGVLERSLAEAGDLVERGQVLARMDEKELRWELASVEAEYNQAAKRYDTALATQSAAAVQLAKFEMEQYQTRMDSLQERMDHLTIRSPLDGVVVRGDLKRSEGAPLTVGQTLFEIAPLDEMVAELEVAEDEVHFVQPGQRVRLRLDADPLRIFTAPIRNLHPRAELRHNATVFIAEVHLPNTDLVLRPGMNGRAKTRGPWRPLGWTFFRRPIQVILQWVGW